MKVTLRGCAFSAGIGNLFRVGGKIEGVDYRAILEENLQKIRD